MSCNPFRLIGKDWMLITAGDMNSWNTMTASWGGMGVLWSMNVCFAFVRPVRHTYGFMEKYDTFTLSFFEERYREALQFCGTKSGRDVDKAAETGLVPFSTPGNSVSFEQARMIIECRKIYFQDIDPEMFLDRNIEECYPDKDYHRLYIGKITGCFVR